MSRPDSSASGSSWTDQGASTNHSQQTYDDRDAYSHTEAPTWNPHTNALLESIDPLPQPYRMLNELLQVTIDRAWERIEKKFDESTMTQRRTGIIIEGQPEEPVPPPSRVQYASQGTIRPQELLTARPSRIVAPASFDSAAASVQATCTCVSLDGRVGLVGSPSGVLYILDLSRGYCFVCSLNGTGLKPSAGGGGPAEPTNSIPDSGVVTRCAISAAPILRGDEDHRGGDESEQLFNYVLAWSIANGPTRVATLNSHTWTTYEGCIVPIQSFPPSSSVVAGLQLSPDASHLSVTSVDSAVAVFSLRPHRYDPALEPVKLSQKEILGNAKLAAQLTEKLTVMNSDSTGGVLGNAAEAMDFAAHGMAVCHASPLVHVQKKLYTATLVLIAHPPTTLVPASTFAIAVTAPSPAPAASPVSPAGALSPRASARKTAASQASAAQQKKKGAAGKGEKDASANITTATPAPAAAATTASPLAPSSSPTSPPSSHPSVSLSFLCSPRERSVGEIASTVTRGVAVVWVGDTKWRRWDLKESLPVMPAMVVVQPPVEGKLGSPQSRTSTINPARKSSTAALNVVAQPTALPIFPASNTFLLGSKVTCVCVDVSTTFLAVGLMNGNCVVFDQRLGCERGVLNATPVLSHTSTSPHPSNSSVTALTFLAQSHLIVAWADRTLRTFTLPGNMGRKVDRKEMEACEARISAKLPGRITSLTAGTKLPVVVVGVTSEDPSSSKKQQQFFLYDAPSNFVLGQLEPSSSSSGPSGAIDRSGNSSLQASARHMAAHLRDTSISHMHEGSASFEEDQKYGGGAGDSMDFSGTAHDFTVFEEKSNEQQDTQLTAMPQLHLRHLSDGRDARNSARQMQSENATFHSLASSPDGLLATVDSDHILLPGTNARQEFTLYVYTLPDVICAIYPFIMASCQNSFLRQQHAVGWYLHHASHTQRRIGASWNNYMSDLNAMIAHSNAAQLHQAFKHGRSPSALASPSGGSVAGKSSFFGASSKRLTSGDGGKAATQNFRSNLSQIAGSRDVSVIGSRAESRSSHPIHSRSPPSHRSGSTTPVLRSLMAHTGGAGPRRTGSSGGSVTSSGHARAASGSRARSTHSSSGHALAAQAAPAHIPRDAAFLVAEQLAQTTISSQQRAVEVKSKRTELQQLLKAQQKSERKAMNAYNGTTTFPQIANLQR